MIYKTIADAHIGGFRPGEEPILASLFSVDQDSFGIMYSYPINEIDIPGEYVTIGISDLSVERIYGLLQPAFAASKWGEGFIAITDKEIDTSDFSTSHIVVEMTTEREFTGFRREFERTQLLESLFALEVGALDDETLFVLAFRSGPELLLYTLSPTGAFIGDTIIAETFFGDLTVGSDRAFVAAEVEQDGVFDTYGVFVGSDGTLQGELFRVKSDVGTADSPDAAFLPNGNLAVAWTDVPRDGAADSEYDIRAKILAPDGSTVVDEFVVSEVTVEWQSGATVVPLENGGFAVLWYDESQIGGDSSGGAVKGRVFGLDGAPRTKEFLVNDRLDGDQSPQGALATGPNSFLVVYSDERSDRLYGTEFTIPSLTGLAPAPLEYLSIAYLYEAGLNRDGAIDLPGLNFWIDQFDGGTSLLEISRLFVQSGEFEAVVGVASELSDRELVERLYRNVLERDGEEGGVAFWTSALAEEGYEPENLLLDFALAGENIRESFFIEGMAEIEEGYWGFV